MRNWFKRDAPVDPMLEEARANLPILEELRGGAGWALVRGWCVGEANKAIQEWTAGVPQERQIVLATRVSAMGWLIDLVDNQMARYRNIVGSEGTTPKDSLGEADGTTPFTDPMEPIEEVE